MAEEFFVSAATGAMGSVLGKLGVMLSNEYKLLKGVRDDIQFLKDELEAMHKFLVTMANVEEPHEQDKLRADAVRDLSYVMEDKIDKFMVLVRREPSSKPDSFMELCRKSMEKINKIKFRHKIAKDVKDIKIRITEVSDRHKRYMMDPSLRATNEKVDPRLEAMFKDASLLVGIDGPTNVLLKWLDNEDGESAHHHQLKVLSIVGSGGLGKTTLARQVYNKLGADYDCRAFVSVSRNPNMASVLRSILRNISNRNASPEESIQQLIEQIREFLQDKRYFIIIDDIWDKNHWYQTLSSALVRNDCGSAIITTTRNIDVAKLCSGSQGDLVYELQPLGVDHSKKLFFKRIFGCEQNCPPNLKEVSDDILKKCGGLPLAINAISSLLTTKERKQESWDRVRRSIGFDKGKNDDIGDMKYILSLSYFELPLDLRSCLLYLTMFPEDYKIERQRLVHRWISEGLIKCRDEEDLFELGEEYFHELVNRSLIQPVGIGYDGKARCCRVHDIVLDFLIHKSAEEKFSTLLSSNPKSDCIVLRTFLVGNEDQASVEKLDLSHARSLGAFGSDVKQLPSFGKSNALRVLDLCECYELRSEHVKDIGRLLQLRYMNISETMVMKLPREIGDLEYLETLSLHMNLQELPESVARLKRLVRLFVGTDAKFPDGIGNMKNLQELGIVDAMKQSVEFLEELGKLTSLRKLKIRWVCRASESGEASDKEKTLMSSLCKLDTCKLRNLSIELWSPEEDATFIGRSFFPNLHSIREIRLGSGWITEWMLSLVNLEKLCLFSCGHEIVQQDVERVGSIPTLLEFCATNRFVGSISISGGFQQLRKFDICARTTELTFEAGALPNLQELFIRWVSFELYDSPQLTFEAGALQNLKEFSLWIRLDKFESAGAGLDFGIQHLTSLDRLRVVIDCAGKQPHALDMALAEGVFKSMADTHPNRPTLKMMKGYNYFGLHDEE
uniref:Predicted protein n=1 Tax=Hordeum vulgare subsp. vulgare TaxID=112509 RepID=F2DCB8_HORVV|nr:predicted protein [Hordeum vulgare subsp. vulgare]